MMNRSTRLNFLLLLSVGLTLGSCKDEPTQMAGIDGSGTTPGPIVTFGTITGFGSVMVNGVRYDTSNATFLVDGQIATETSLAVGDVVIVRGSVDVGGATGSADNVIFDDIVEDLEKRGTLDTGLVGDTFGAFHGARPTVSIT